MTSRRRWILAVCGALFALIGAGAWASSGSGDPTAPSTTSTPASATPRPAPKASVADDAQFLTDVTTVDPTLTSYEKRSGNVALRSLLTDGAAFCSFLNRYRDI